MRNAMIGEGDVGLVPGNYFSDFGHDVIFVDTDESRFSALQSGSVPIFGPELEALMQRTAGKLLFTAELGGPASEADGVFIAVGTPSRRGDGHADIYFMEQAPAVPL